MQPTEQTSASASGVPSKSAAPARTMMSRGSLTPKSAACQLSVACTAPPEAVTLPALSADATAGPSSASADASASHAPAWSALRGRRALIGPRRHRLGRLSRLGRLGALLGPRLVELDPPARILVAALLERELGPERAPRAPLEARHGPGGEAVRDELARDRPRQLLARLALPDHEAAARVLARPARVALAILDDVVAAHGARPQVGARDAHVLERRVEHAHGLAGELGDVLHELLALLRALLDGGQAVLPVAGQCRGGQRVLAQQAHDVDALLGRDERARVALDVADVDEALDDRGARRGRADARLLHRLAHLLVVDELAGGLHGAQQRGVAVAPRRLGLLLERLGLARVDGLAALQARELLVAPLVLVAGAVALGQLAVDAAPAGDEQHLAARAEDVRGDRGLHARVLELRVGVEDGEEAPRHQVVDPAVVVVHLLQRVVGVGGDDRVVIADLGVVDHPPERQQVERLHVGRGLAVLGAAPDAAGDLLELRDHVARQVARAGARIGQGLVLLVAALRGAQRAARAEAVARVGLALQRREVVQERRALLALGLVELGDLAAHAAHGGDDGVRLVGALQARLGAGVEAALVAARALGLEGGVDQPVLLGLEGADLLLAARDDGQRRRLHAPERDGAVERGAQPDGGRARGVHADDPVGLRARLRRVAQLAEVRLVAQLAEGVAHRLIGHRVQPQALDGLLRLHVLVDVGEDQFALAPGVAGVDDRLDVLAAQLVAHDLHLLLGALVAHHELEGARHDRQIGHAPLLELVVVLVGLGELDEVTDGPGDDVLRALQPARGLVPHAGVLLERAGQYAGEVLADGRLLGDDEGLGHGRRRVAQPAHGPVDTELSATRSRSRATTEFGTP